MVPHLSRICEGKGNSKKNMRYNDTRKKSDLQGLRNAKQSLCQETMLGTM